MCERERERVIETNAQTHRMWCVRGLGKETNKQEC